MTSTLTFSAGPWLLPALVALVVALALVLWSYRSGPGGWERWGGGSVKVLGIAALVFFLLEPLWLGQRVKPGENLFALVADNSQGLQVADEGESKTRGEALRTLLGPEGGSWQSQMEEDFALRRFRFDSRLQSVAGFDELRFDGESSAIGGALVGLTERFTGRPLAGVLFFTDGNATDLRAGLPNLAGLPPVYPVLVGRPGAVRDVSIVQAPVTQTAFEDAPVSANVEVSAVGLRGETVVARLVDEAGRELEERRLRVRKDQETLPFRFQWRPEAAGVSFPRVVTGLEGELGTDESSVRSTEATRRNNTAVLAVDRGRGPYRILYVAGRPNWEYKFLNRALQADDQVQLVALIRIARREPKFDFRGRAGETGNPLFRGFGGQSREEVERYDQPVLTRLNTRDELELRGGFPLTAEELYGFHAVILDDVEAAFFSADQALLLQKFVSERGGGLLMLGGAESFQEGGYARTPVGDLLPVYLDRAENRQPGGPVRLELSREGWLEAWARLRDNEGAEKSRLQSMPVFHVRNPVREIKPGASLVATGTDETGTAHPLLVTQRFGRGRSAALMVGDTWRWGMQNAEARRDMDKAWRQLARWLVADVPGRVDVAVEPTGAAGGAVQLQVRVRSARFEPVDDAAVTLEVTPVLAEADGGSTNSIRLRPEASLREAGLYEVAYLPHHAGGYRATAWVTNSTGVAEGTAEAGWSTDLAGDEFRSLQPNVTLLQTIASQTGGEVVSAADLADFARRIPQRQAPVMEPWTMPAWHSPFMLVFALACFLTEWGWRRWRGLP
ncbi:MAG: glutamine amidotransferase [Limisphaerales bacterium]